MSYLLGIDIGTSGTKTLICDYRGRVRATATAPHDIDTPRPGWSQQDPVQWWRATCRATRAVLRKARTSGKQVTAIGLSGQMHGSVFLADDERICCLPTLHSVNWPVFRGEVRSHVDGQNYRFRCADHASARR